MYKKIVLSMMAMSVMQLSTANDTIGEVSIGGIQYLKSKDIVMDTEDLFISKNKIKVDYQFLNLSTKDISETILFPLPQVESYSESPLAHAPDVIDSFKILVNGKSIKPTAHVRAFMQNRIEKADGDWDLHSVDVTEVFKQCGLSDSELMNPWTGKVDSSIISKKILNCKPEKIKKLLADNSDENEVLWQSQIIYSWPQTFKAKAMTRVQHEYKPLVGGSFAISLEDENNPYCMDQNFIRGVKNSKLEYQEYSNLGYILTTGANWARPIRDFKLTLERDVNELVSLCWDGKVTKISPTRFEMKEKNFTPKQDINVVFVTVK